MFPNCQSSPGDAAELHQQQRQGGHRASSGAHELHLVLTDKAITVPSCGVDENHEVLDL